MAHFAAFVYWEAKWAKAPLLAVDIWKVKSFAAVALVLFFVFMSLGIYIWYVTLFLQRIRDWDPVLLGCAWIPMAISGCFAAFSAAWTIPRVPAQIIIAFGCLGAAVMNLLVALMPKNQTIWAMVFPAMIIAASTGDMVFAAGQIIASSNVPRKHQGAAGSLIGALFTYGLSTGLGFAGTVENYINNDGKDLLRGYKGATYLAVGFAVTALILDSIFVRMEKNSVEGWQGEDADGSL